MNGEEETPEQFFKKLFEAFPPPTAADLTPNDASLKEELALKKHVDLEDRQALNELNRLGRADKLNIHLHRVSVLLLYLAAFLISAMVCVLVYHMVAPDRLKFLTSDETSKIYEFLFTGVSGGLITGLTSKYVAPKKEGASGDSK